MSSPLERGARWAGGVARVCATIVAHAALAAALPSFAPLAGAAETAPAVYRPHWMHESSDLPPDPQIKFGQLANGLRYAVRSNAEPAGRVFLILRVQAGSVYERDDQQGYAHFVEHLAFNGTKKFPGDSLVSTMQRNGYSLGAHVSAFTGYVSTFYQLDVPRTDDATLDQAFGVLGEWAQHVTFDPKEVKKEFGVVESERRAYVVAPKDVSREIETFLYRDTRFAARPVLGRTDQLKRATAEQLREYYRTWYRPSRMTVIAVGDLPVEKLAALVERHCSGYVEPATPAPAEPALGSFAPPDATDARYIATQQPGGISNVVYSVQTNRDTIDNAEARRANVALAAAYWMLHERLQRIVRAAPLDYGQAQAGWFDFYEAADVGYLRLDTPPALWRRGVTLLDRELRRAVEFGFSDDEVEAQRGRFETNYVESIRSTAKTPSVGLAQMILQSIELGFVPTAPADTWETVREAVQQLTPDQCLAALRRAWPGEARRFVVLGTEAKLTDHKSILGAIADSRRLAVVDEKPAAVEKTFAYTFDGAPGEIASRRHDAEVDVHLVDFANGVRLAVKRTDYDPNQIYTQVRLGYGLVAESREHAGIATAAATVLIAGGLGRHDENALSRIFAAEALNLQFQVAEDAFEFSGSASRASFRRLLELNTAYLRDAAFRPAPMFTAINQLRGYYDTVSTTPEQFTVAYVPRLVHAGDHRYGLPHAAAVFRHSPTQVREWIEPVLAHGPLQISVIGDLDVEETIREIARTFGTLAPRETRRPFDSVLRPRFAAKKSEETIRVQKGLKKASVLVAWPFEVERPIEDPRRVRMLTLIMQLRMHHRIREELGATYAPVAEMWQSSPWPTQGYLYASAVVEPGKVKKVARLLREIAEELATRGVTADEFAQVHQPKLAVLEDELRDNGYWLHYVLPYLAEEPWTARLPLSRTADYRSITAEELSQFARRYLRPAQATTLIVTSS